MMDINLFLVIPLALIWDIFAKKQEEKNIKKKIITGIIFCVFAILFIITYIIFNKYVDINLGLDGLQKPKSISHLIVSSSTQLEFFILIGIIFNALMQGYVCVNSIYIFLI